MRIVKERFAYMEDARVSVSNGACFLCGETKVVITVDTSDGEYADISLCQDCVAAECSKGDSE
jgi:hypothetical protein